MKRRVNLGLVGFGRWGRVYAKTINDLEGINLSTVASGKPDIGSLVPADCSVTSDWRNLITDAGLDGIILTVPPQAQVDIAEAALEAGIPVLLEKPLALDLDSAQRLVRVAEQNRSFAMVDHTHLFHPAYLYLKERLADSGGADSVTWIFAEAGNWGPFRSAIPVLWDWGAHDVAMVLDIMDRSPLRVSASNLERRKQKGGIGERIEMRIEFEKFSATILLDNLRPDKKRLFEVQADEVVLRYDGVAMENFASRPASGADWDSKVIEGPLPLENVLLEFADGIRAGSNNQDGLCLGVNVVAVLEMCQLSLERGGWVSI